MTNKTIKELTVPIPCYAERFLSTLARKTGLDENEIALFFLCREAYHAQPRGVQGKRSDKMNLPRNGCAEKLENQ